MKKANKQRFEKTNLDYEVEYDYERSGCQCNAYETGDYCRCTTIERAWVEEIFISSVVEKLYKKFCKEHSEINEYCFDRICHALRIYDKDLYEVETGGGYYGEEVYGVYFDNEEQIFNAYAALTDLSSDIEKIKYVLNLEYGYLIDRVANTTSATIHKVDAKKIILPQQEYFIKLSKEVIEDYKNRKLPVAVCVKQKDRFLEEFDRYVLIDDYHRWVANKDRDTVEIVVLE